MTLCACGCGQKTTVYRDQPRTYVEDLNPANQRGGSMSRPLSQRYMELLRCRAGHHRWGPRQGYRYYGGSGEWTEMCAACGQVDRVGFSDRGDSRRTIKPSEGG